MRPCAALLPSRVGHHSLSLPLSLLSARHYSGPFKHSCSEWRPIPEKPFEFIRSAKLDRGEQQESATKDSRQVIPIISVGAAGNGAFCSPLLASARLCPDPLKADPAVRSKGRHGLSSRSPFRETRSFREVETCFQDSN